MTKKSKYSIEIEDFIARYHAIGLPLNRIARALGIKESTVYSWCQRKKALRIKIAELELAEAERRMQGVPDTWWLERKFPEQFCKDTKENQSINLSIQMLIDARAQLEATPGLEEEGIIDVESTNTLLLKFDSKKKIVMR
jgi:hypothetical protein